MILHASNRIALLFVTILLVKTVSTIVTFFAKDKSVDIFTISSPICNVSDTMKLDVSNLMLHASNRIALLFVTMLLVKTVSTMVTFFANEISVDIFTISSVTCNVSDTLKLEVSNLILHASNRIALLFVTMLLVKTVSTMVTFFANEISVDIFTISSVTCNVSDTLKLEVSNLILHASNRIALLFVIILLVKTVSTIVTLFAKDKSVDIFTISSVTCNVSKTLKSVVSNCIFEDSNSIFDEYSLK